MTGPNADPPPNISGPGTALAGVPAIEAARTRLHGTAARRFARTRLINLLPILALGIPCLMFAIGASLAWRSVVADAERQLDRLAGAAAEYGARTIDAYTLAAARSNDRLARLADLPQPDQQEQAHQALAQLTGELRQPVVAFAVDRNGFPIAASHLQSVPQSVSLADRDFFQALSVPGAPSLHIGRMFFGRFDGRLFIAFSAARRRADATGEAAAFDGLTTISVDPNMIGEGLRRLIAEPGDTLALMRGDGEYIASSIPHDRPLAAEPAGSTFHALAATARTSGSYRSNDDAAEQLVAIRRLDGIAAYAVARRTLAAVRAEWRASLAPHLLFGIPATAALFLLSLRVRRESLLLHQVNAALRRDVESSADRLHRAQRYALVGTFEVDLRSGDSFRSPEYLSLHGLPPGAARESHADWLKRLHPEDRDAAEATLLGAISDDSTATEYAQTYRTVTPSGQTRWIAAHGQIERDAAGRAMTLRGVHADVTMLRTAEEALAETNARFRLAQEALDIGNWEWRAGTRRLFLSRKARELLGFVPDMQSPRWSSVFRLIHPADRADVRAAIAEAFAGQILRLEFRILRPRADGGTDAIWLMARARALRTSGGNDQQHLVGIAYDITDRKMAEERTAFMAREVEHRSKNLITLVLGILRMTEAPSVESLREILEGRLSALFKTINLLSQSHWTSVSLREIAQQELAPFFPQDAGAGCLSGPDVELGPDVAQPLSMALHELATNAAKYGALTSDAGTVDLSWSVDAEVLRMVWKERGGPPLAGEPEREGFGSALIHSALGGRIEGIVVRIWEADGLRCEITLPAEHLRRPEVQAAAPP